MGPDAVEIILHTEELFAMEIQDEEAARVETVGQFYDLICSQLEYCSAQRRAQQSPQHLWPNPPLLSF
jgi:hypothetical protein